MPMKKLAAFVLSLLLLLPLAGGATAEEFKVSDYIHPYSGTPYTERSFDGSGKIWIILTHTQSIIWRERTPEDFPHLEVEAVGPDDPMSEDQEFRQNNPEYREVIWIILKDKSNKAVIDAIQHLYDSHKYYYASPNSQTRPMGDANGDYKTNLLDVSHMLKHIAGWESCKIDRNNRYYVDLYYDELITMSDVTILLKFLAGWEWYVNHPVFSQ